MSEYQYYEFLRINGPLSQAARKEMASLSSRARISTHGASYVYNYGDFPGDPKSLLLKHFDVFFYISNWGAVQLMFKYLNQQIDINEIKRHAIPHVIICEQHDENILIDICMNNEEGFGWTEGEGVLLNLLPLYEEVKDKNYQILNLAGAINDEFSDSCQNVLSSAISITSLSSAQRSFLDCVGIGG